MASSVDNNTSEELIGVKDWFLLGTDLESWGQREYLQYANENLGTTSNLSHWDPEIRFGNFSPDGTKVVLNCQPNNIILTKYVFDKISFIITF